MENLLLAPLLEKTTRKSDSVFIKQALSVFTSSSNWKIYLVAVTIKLLIEAPSFY